MALGRATVGTYFVNVVPNMNKFSSTLASSASGASSLLQTVFGTGLGVALGGAISSAFDTFIGGISRGISRLDTMEGFEKVMLTLGESSDDVAASVERMGGALDGLPTAASDMASWVQQIRASGEPLDRATSLGIALNDAMLAGAASSSEVANAMDAYNTILAQGVPDLEHWRTLVNTSPAAMDQLAKALLGGSAGQMDLYNAMKDGTVSLEDFNDALITLNEEGANGLGSFEEQARAATGGIGTALENVQNRIGKFWEVVLDAIGSERIAGLINGITEQFVPFARNLAPYIEEAANLFFDFIGSAQETFGQLQTVVWPYVEEFISLFQEGWANFQAVLESDTMSGAITTLSDAFTWLSEVLTPFMNDVIMPLASAVIPMLGTVIGVLAVTVTNTVTAIVTAIDTVIAIVTAWAEGVQAAADWISSTFETIKTKIGDAMSNVAQRITDGWEQAKANASAKLDALKSKVQDAWNTIKSNVSEKVDSIKEKISSGFESAKGKVTEVFNTIKEKIVNPIKEAKDKVTRFIDEISSAISGVHLQLPSIPMPHFHVYGGSPPWGIMGQGSMPRFSVSWKAAGGLLNGATLFGAGERGTELIWPSYSPYLERYADAIASRMGGTGNTYLTIDGSMLEADSRLASLVGQVVDYAINTYSMGRA